MCNRKFLLRSIENDSVENDHPKNSYARTTLGCEPGSSFCTLITEAANVARFLADFASLLVRWVKARGERREARPEVGSMLHDRKHFAYFPFHSRTLQPTYLPTTFSTICCLPPTGTLYIASVCN